MPREVDKFIGIWYQHKKSENLSAFYEQMGYNRFTKFWNHSEPTLTLQKLCCLYRLKAFLGSRIDFKPGRTFYELCIGNGLCKSKILFEGNKMIHVQQGRKKVVTVREFTDDLLTVTMTVDHVYARRYFERTDECYC